MCTKCTLIRRLRLPAYNRSAHQRTSLPSLGFFLVKHFKQDKISAMTDAMFRFSVKWAGSNQHVASLQVPAKDKPAWLINRCLQARVGALVNIHYRNIKILLGSPAGPQLTPVLLTSSFVRAKTRFKDLPSHKAMVAAWSSLNPGQTYNVFVTQHNAVALAVDRLVREFSSDSRDWYAYNDLPPTLKRNPVVALAAMKMNDRLYVRLPEELNTNKQFALAAISQTRAHYSILTNFSSELRDDEQVVLQAVARFPQELWEASKRLLTCKMFALAVVRQNKAAFNYLSYELQADTDVQAARCH